LRTFRLAVCCLASLWIPSALLGASCAGPSYENTVRQWGQVVNVFTDPSGVVFAFYMRDWRPADTTTPTGASVRIECGTNAVALGCDRVAIGDSALVSGHLEEYASCRVTGPDDVTVPNLIYRCAGHTSGTCQLLTPCN
jgi:hypothetical protein